jgi:flagellin-specific chaperone FliS
MKNTSKSAKIDMFFNKASHPKAERFVNLNLSITTTIHKTLEERNITISEFAVMLKRDEETVGNMLTGLYNLTLRDIVDMEYTLDCKLLNN